MRIAKWRFFDDDGLLTFYHDGIEVYAEKVVDALNECESQLAEARARDVHWDCRIAQLENAVRILADKLLVSPVGFMSIQEYNELVKMVKKVLRSDDFVGDSDHEHDDRIL